MLKTTIKVQHMYVWMYVCILVKCQYITLRVFNKKYHKTKNLLPLKNTRIWYILSFNHTFTIINGLTKQKLNKHDVR